jgi:hypothetical protein
MGLLKVHYTAPRRAASLDFSKNSGRPGHLESGFLIQVANEKTAVFAGYIKPRESDLLFGFEKPPFTTLWKHRGFHRYLETVRVTPFIRFLKTAAYRILEIPRFLPVLKNRINVLTIVA